LDDCQKDYLICHLLQVKVLKKLFDETKALLKQLVHVPTDFNGLGTQIQLFTAAPRIVFWQRKHLHNKSLTKAHHDRPQQEKLLQSNCLRQVLLHKIPICSGQASAMLAHNVQACTQLLIPVNNRVLQFDNLIDGFVNGTFHMTLPTTLKKIQGVSPQCPQKTKIQLKTKRKEGVRMVKAENAKKQRRRCQNGKK
jgi:hypothetical protein